MAHEPGLRSLASIAKSPVACDSPNKLAIQPMTVTSIINLALWATWLGYWIVAARSVAHGASFERRASRLLHLGAALAALALLVFHPIHVGLPGGAAVDAAGDVVTGLGLAFAIWARLHLGRQWSGRVEVKQGHFVVRTGPYAWVRHPIYAGILVAIAGSAIVARELTSALAVVIMAAAYWRKVRMEETVLLHSFGPEYQAYRREVKALVPFII
jgi:protein-S-isoprenylcysteine O-methyltransferase Ste14